MQLAIPKSSAKLTKLERKWYGEFLKDFDTLEAFRRVKATELKQGLISDDVVRSLAYQVKKSALQKLRISDDDIRDQMGFNRQELDNRLRQLFDAKKPVVIKDKVAMFEDNLIRKQSIELAYKLTGELKDKVELTGKDGGPIQMQVIAGIGFLNKPTERIEEVDPEIS